MKKLHTNLLVTLLALEVPMPMSAQREATVNGHYTYTVSDNDNITLKAAKHKCIELAKAEAIKAEFGELITSDVIDSNAETNGEAASSFFWENTVAMARGEWLADKEPPHISIKYADGKLQFTAEVCGQAREIVQSETQLKWEVLKDTDGKKTEVTEFKSGERVYVNFLAPADGYLAIYLIEGENETSCLLPYRRDPTGRVTIKRGQRYKLFDKTTDPTAVAYRLSTKKELEYNQLVIIYSPNPFTKCIDNVRDPRHPNSLSTREFQKWLLSCQRTDRDMVVKKKWVQITGTTAKDK